MARECLQEGISRGAQPVSLLQDMLCTLLAEAVDELSRGEDQATDAPPCACAAESPSGSSLGGPGVPCAEAGRSLAGTVRPRTLFASAASEGCPATAEAVGSCRQWSSGNQGEACVVDGPSSQHDTAALEHPRAKTPAGRTQRSLGSPQRLSTPRTARRGNRELRALTEFNSGEGGTIHLLTPVRASSSQFRELGSTTVLTRVRRSARKHMAPQPSLEEMLEECHFSYAPNRSAREEEPPRGPDSRTVVED
mmetsp:Transcript_3823/g.9085  ORF Transcript_3823/g.9085 Transcript_3823/m.9085 type:complete len:251 (-) Transcript_3823:102-854(-)